MRNRLHRAILRSASFLVPCEQRVEWLAEWEGELWHVRDARGTAEGTTFCLGAYKDAFWLHRNRLRGEEHQSLHLGSPARSLALLAALAVLAWFLVLMLPGLGDSRFHFHRAVGGFLTSISLACLIVTVNGSLSLGEYPTNRKSPPLAIRLRRWWFLAAKFTLLLLIVYCGAFMFDSFFERAGRAAGFMVQVLVWGPAWAFRWVLSDQRKRCPVCLRLLENPVRVGQPSGYFLEWNCIEFMCSRGHGLLYIPESHTSWFNRQRWFYLEP